MIRVLKSSISTSLKYFLSYFIILSIAFLGFYFTIHFELKNEYVNNLNLQAEIQLESVSDMVKTKLEEIDQINLSLQKNATLLMARYDNTQYSHYLYMQELQKQITGNFFIKDILYLDYDKKEVNSLKSYGRFAKQDENIIELFVGNRFIELPDFTASTSSQFNIINKEGDKLIYFYPNQTSDKYNFIYIINEYELLKIVKTGISSYITSLCLYDNEQEMVTGIQQEDFNNQYEYTNDNNFFSNKSDYFSIAAKTDKTTLLKSVDAAFKNTYLIMIIIGIVGGIGIMFSMQITYKPLQKLTKKLTNSENAQGEYIAQIDQIFEAAKTENNRLQDKINHYRMIMQHSILASSITGSDGIAEYENEQIEQFFSEEAQNLFFVVYMEGNEQLAETIKSDLKKALPEESAVIILGTEANDISILINYIGEENHKEEVLLFFLDEKQANCAVKIALSNSSSNPLEIPTLFENAKLAYNNQNVNKVIQYNKLLQESLPDYKVNYPYKKLDSFSAFIKDFEFVDAYEALADILTFLSERENPVFYIRCILIDILTIIISLMNKMNIKFEKFSDIYYETLHSCRSYDNREALKHIFVNIEKMLLLFQKELSSSSISVSHLKEYIINNYATYELSINSVADHFHVSIAYISYLFKKKLDINFSEFIWKLRLEKAQELLRTTSMSVDEISLKVGYQNASSFRRKYKQNTGITPMQYRNDE